MKQVLKFALAIALGVVLGGVVFNLSKNKEKKESQYVYDGESSKAGSVKLPENAYQDFTYAAETGVKSVVHVKVTIKGKQGQMNDPFSMLEFFFGYGKPQQPRDQQGAGSGVIITEDGYIVTNNHVIEGANDIEVTLDNNSTFKATVIGADKVTDIALIKIDAHNLPVLNWGDSDDLRLGEWVIAIGNPFNLRSTITAGIVSAKGRSMPNFNGEFKIEAFIQTDAAVNPGNSGGALLNTKGEIVGINTAIATNTGSYAGYSFAVPSAIAKKVVDDMIKYNGVVQRAMLGVTMREITGEFAQEKGIDKVKGVWVHAVTPDGAADKAGIKEGDIILSIDGKEVNTPSAIQEIITKHSPADKVEIEIKRGDKSSKVIAELQNQVGGTQIVNAEEAQRSVSLGAQLRDVSNEVKSELRIKGGVEVVSLGEGKFKDAGIKAGFIITHINQKPVTSVKELETAIQKSSRGCLVEGVYPDGKAYFYAISK